MLATDFSPCAENAMRYAVAMAAHLSAEITILHFAHPTQAVDNNVWNAYFMEDLLEAKREALKAWAAKFNYPDLTINTVCEIDFLVGGLARYAEENDMDMLIMGSTGATGIVGILGSNAAGVVANTQLPTLLVPLDGVYKDNPLVVLATDFVPMSDSNAATLKEMAIAMQANALNVLHVCATSDIIPKTAQEERLKDALYSLPLVFHYIQGEEVEGAISEFMANNDIDLLCSVTHQHSFLHRLLHKNKVKTLVNKMLKPVLVLHDK